jgi:hypothetical protein
VAIVVESDAGAAPTPPVPARQELFARRLPVAVAGFVLGAIAGASLYAAWPRHAAPKVPAVMSRSEPPPSPRITPFSSSPPPVTPAPLPTAPPPAAKTSLQRTPIEKAKATGPDRDTQLAAERAFIETARAAVARGDSLDALETIERHARRFPDGRLAEERDSLWVQALVGAGRFDEARQRATRFRRDYPDSMLLPAVEAAERSIP